MALRQLFSIAYRGVAGLNRTQLSPVVKQQHQCASMSTWRDDNYIVPDVKSAWPNYIKHLTHHKHYRPPHTYGAYSRTRLRVVDNSKIGREAMAEGKPPYVIRVYSPDYERHPHGAKGKLGDRVMVAIKGQKKHGVIVGLRSKQRPGVPRFDSNNVVLIEENGTPLGTRIHAPLPNVIRPLLKKMSHPKRADYTKILAIATRFV